VLYDYRFLDFAVIALLSNEVNRIATLKPKVTVFFFFFVPLLHNATYYTCLFFLSSHFSFAICLPCWQSSAMMGYEGRSLLLDDEEEWVNIPLVVREFMRQLNDEVQASRTVMELMRQEQKEVNLLLRRVMQKQADLEIDNTRNTLSISRAATVTTEATQKRHTEQIHYLRKKQEKLDERIELLVSSFDKIKQAEATTLAGPSTRELADKTNSLATRVDRCKTEFCDQLVALEEAQQSLETQLASSVASAVADINKALREQSDSFAMRLAAVEQDVGTQRSVLEEQKHERAVLKSLFGDLSDTVERDRQVSKERLSACFQMVEKAEELCAAQHNSIKAEVSRIEDAVESNARKTRDDAKSLYVELRDVAKREQHVVVLRCNELAEELLSVKEQQKRFQEQLASNDSGVSAQQALKTSKELLSRISDLEADVEKQTSAYALRRDHEKLQQEGHESLNALKVAHEEATASLQSQVQQLRQSLKTLRTEQGEDNDWLHNELGRLSTVFSYNSQQRERHDRQVASLCDIVHNLSIAVETLQTAPAKTVSGNTGSTAPAGPAVAASQNGPVGVSPPYAVVDSSASADASGLPLWEAWRVQIGKDIEAKLSVVPILQQRCERFSHQVNELSAKVDGGARYAQSVASQQMEQMRQTVKDEVRQQLQTHIALRELTPALVEVEAVKRRVAGLELEMQSATTRAEQRRTDDVVSFSSASATSADVLRRLAFVEGCIDGFKRRLVELGEHMVEVEQLGNAAARTSHQLESRLEDEERAVAKLGTDLTAALESLLRTEGSLSQHQERTASQLMEVHTLVGGFKRELTAFAEGKESDDALRGAIRDVQKKVGELQGEVAQLCADVKDIPDKVASEVTEQQVRPLRTEFDALRQDGAVAASKLSDETTSRVNATTEALAAMKSEIARELSELRQHLADKDSELHTLSERLSAVESVAVATSSLSHDTSTTTPASAAHMESKAVLARCTEEMHACHRRLDAQQQRIGMMSEELVNAVAEQDAATRREWQVKGDTLRDEMVEWMTSYTAAQIKKCHEELRGLVNDAARAALFNSSLTSTAEAAAATDCGQPHVAELRQLVDNLRLELEGNLSSAIADQKRKQDDVMNLVESVQVSAAELRREVYDALTAQQEGHEVAVRELRDALDELREGNAASALGPSPASSTHSPGAEGRALQSGQANLSAVREEECSNKWEEDVLQRVHAEFYSKTLLEERLENIWSSMVSLLARKEDMVAVNEKLNGLHKLMQEELQIEMEKLEDQLASQLADKVSLRSLQDILEEHYADPHTSA
jgi:hypothetical protein